ncbi:nuclear transport factor 2 family protein [Brevundimonas terrae]|uniref:Nuclear transport factor 2 family protein n=1 Tax=Brevundimonas terrae TaxID=363631 RepID=A0ABN0Y933_9CAUL|nr:nuclear transport factor 2 family protein [Brevundimonas terrae]NIJ25308.1 ketosteroid isomerase-like protein [Brevundimonas terrae]
MSDANLSGEAAIRELADRFISAIEQGDIDTVRACYDPDVVVWLNTVGAGVDRQANLDVLKGFVGKTSERRYLNRRVQVFAGGYVQQHLLNAVHVKGPVLELAATLVCRVENGRITRLDEYFDSKPLTDWATQISQCP